MTKPNTLPNTLNAPLGLEPQIDEDRVRRALGLKSSGTPHQQRPEQARQRHRFVADGAVPVVMLNRTDSETASLRDRVAALEAALEAERAGHAATRRTLADAQAAHQTLQTRLGHTELDHADALRTERDARRAAEEALAAAQAEAMAPPPLRMRKPIVAAADTLIERAIRKPRAESATKSDKPVRWWTPSYRAKSTT